MAIAGSNSGQENSKRQDQCSTAKKEQKQLLQTGIIQMSIFAALFLISYILKSKSSFNIGARPVFLPRMAKQ